MKCGILTFSFAHNYGALLQAMSLKKYLEQCGHDVEQIYYAPKNILSIYSLNPFAGRCTVRSIISSFLRLPYRFLQYYKFERFISELNGKEKKISDLETLHRKEKEFEAIIVGSDQVWNDFITGNINEYYLPFVSSDVLKISYAASFGKKQLSDYQRKCTLKYLSDFSSISLREEDGKSETEKWIGKNVKIVLDPVFLTSAQEWIDLSKKSEFKDFPKEKYILFYSLSFHSQLINFANNLANESKLKVYSIHPTAMKCSVDGKQLFNVGPYEFLKLINNAEIICTDSFHATAFSVIFHKKLAHIINNGKESRVKSLLERINAYSGLCLKNGITGIVDLSRVDENKLNHLISESKCFLLDALSKRNV